MRPRLDPNLIKIAYWLRVNGPSTQEEIESGTGIKLTEQIKAQGDFTGVLVFAQHLERYV